MKKFFRIAGIAILLIALLFPWGLPDLIAQKFLNIVGIYFLSGGWFPIPNLMGWALVLTIYFDLFLLFWVLKRGVQKNILSTRTSAAIFIITTVIFALGVSFFGNSNNYSPLRCAIVLDSPPGQFEAQNKSECYYWLAMGTVHANPDERYCDKIPSERMKNDCYEQVGFRKRDPELCNLIQNVERRQTCFTNNSKFYHERACDAITSGQDAKNACYFTSAQQERHGDLTLCRLITDLSMKKDCYVQVLMYDGSIYSCSELEDINLASECDTIIRKLRETIKSCYGGRAEEVDTCYRNALGVVGRNIYSK